MINRENWKAVRSYLQYRREVDLVSKSSQRLEESWLRHLLEWADSAAFVHVEKIRPSYPHHLRGFDFSPVYYSHLLRSARRFLRWLSHHRRGYAGISVAWLDTLKVGGYGSTNENIHEFVSLDEIRAIASAPVQNIGERRIRASAVFWWLSGIRVGAFVSLPVSAVDLDTLTVKQFPRLGVRTKFKKHATTFLLDISDLLEVVRSWDKEVRASGSRFWFAPVSPETGRIVVDPLEVGVHRASIARRDLRLWLDRVGLPYHSPHKFRHGHAVYALKQAKDIPALKAISQNLMHANLSVTDGVYGILSDNDVKAQIHGLGKSEDGEQVLRSIREFLKGK